jgi:chitinase
MSSPSCLQAGCHFSGPAGAGPCTANPGTLSDVEIRNIIAAGATVTLDPVAAVQIVTYNTNQWVSVTAVGNYHIGNWQD